MSLQVLIVEDEIESRRHLNGVVAWSRFDMRVVAAVADVEEASAIIRSSPIDLVLLDITLRNSNGLDLVADLRSAALPPRIIVISGHSEFSILQQALRLGVDDYILKPFAPQELLMSVLSNREHLLDRLKREQTRASLQEVMVAGWLDRVIFAESDREAAAAARLLGEHDCTIPPEPRVVLCGDVAVTDGADATRERWLGHVVSALRTTLVHERSVSWVGTDGRVYTVLGGAEASELTWDAHDIAKEFHTHASRYLPVSVRFGISSPGASTLGEAGRQARAALEHSVAEGAASVGWDDTLAPTAECDEPRANVPSLYERARRFIESYHRDPTLDVGTVAAHLGVSTEYLRRAFKSHDAPTCGTVIARRRLAHACSLLADPRLRISDIASRAGYRDAAYFSRRFHAEIGVTPSAYRAAQLGGAQR